MFADGKTQRDRWREESANEQTRKRVLCSERHGAQRREVKRPAGASARELASTWGSPGAGGGGRWSKALVPLEAVWGAVGG